MNQRYSKKIFFYFNKENYLIKKKLSRLIENKLVGLGKVGEATQGPGEGEKGLLQIV